MTAHLANPDYRDTTSRVPHNSCVIAAAGMAIGGENSGTSLFSGRVSAMLSAQWATRQRCTWR